MNFDYNVNQLRENAAGTTFCMKNAEKSLCIFTVFLLFRNTDVP